MKKLTLLILKEPLIRKRIFKTALPAMMEMILYMLIGVVDIAIVGRLGAVPLAAVALGAQIFFGLVLLLESLGIGAAILVAQAKGAGNRLEISRVAGQSFMLAVVVGTAAAVLGLWLAEPFVGLFAVEAEVERLALLYIHIVFSILPVALTLYIINSVYRGLGRTDIPMTIAFVVNIVNCAANYILVYGMGPIPALGVAGSALASSLAHVVGLVMACWYFFGGRGGLKVKFRLTERLNWPIIQNIFRLGLPSMGEQFFLTVSGLISVFLIVFLGTTAYASHEVALAVESLSIMPGFGVAIAATALVGQAVGARDRLAVQKMARGSLELAVLLMGLLGVVFFCFPQVIARIFTNDPVLITLAGSLVRIAAFEQLTIALSMTLAGILKGAGDTRTPMYVTTLATWVFRIPIMYLLIKVLGLSIAWIWVVFVIDWLLRSLVFIIVYQRKRWMYRALGPELEAG